MNGDRFEQDLKRQSMRPVPAEWRQDILATAREAGERERSRVPRTEAGVSWWGAWSWPSRLAWGGLAAAWVAILTLNWAADRPGGPGAVESVFSPAVVALALQQSQQIAAGLDGPDALESRPPNAERPRSARPIELRTV
jgi:hypothetical protein